MNIGMSIGMFLLGMLIGAVSIIILCVLLVDSMNHKKELTKEEWKIGLHLDQAGRNGSALVVYTITVIVTILLFYVVLR